MLWIGMVCACHQPKSEQEIFTEKQWEQVEPMAAIPEPEKEITTLEQTLLDQGLVNLEEVIPGIGVELMYSTTDNFFGMDVYGELTDAYLQADVAERLKTAQSNLQATHPHLSLHIYDAVRPLSVQQILWDHLDKPDSVKPLYVADPKKGSLHNYGVAVDLTIYDHQADSVLDMGTSYDFFGFAAYPDREEQMLQSGVLTMQQVSNRKILRTVMTEAGFFGIGSEWWHFNAYSRKQAAKRYALVN